MSGLRSSQHVLVTGANGFVGRHLIPFLMSQGIRVKAAIRSESRAAMLPADVETVVVGEINEETNWGSVLKDAQAVIHLAGISSSSRSIHEIDYFNANVSGTVNLAKQAADQHVQHFIFMSSIHAVAFRSERPITENTPCLPHSFYGQSKLQAERAVIRVAKNRNMNWTILRSAPVYGLGHRGNLSRLVRWVQSGVPLPFSRVRNLRSLIYIDNLLDLILKVLCNPKAYRQVFLVSNREILSTPEILKLISQTLGQPSFLFPLPLPWLRFLGSVGDFIQNTTSIKVPFNRGLVDGLLGSLYCDCAHVKESLGWGPPISTAEGLSLMMEPKNQMEPGNPIEPKNQIELKNQNENLVSQ